LIIRTRPLQGLHKMIWQAAWGGGHVFETSGFDGSQQAVQTTVAVSGDTFLVLHRHDRHSCT
jgi:hypothetical protein